MINPSKLILHCGTGKTGTTAIQQAIYRNQALLNSCGISTLHNLQLIDGRQRRGKFCVRPKNITPAQESLVQDYLDCLGSSFHTILLSSESFWTSSPNDLKRLIGIFDGFEVYIVIYLRPQAEYLQSIFLQLLKTSHRRSEKPLDYRLVDSILRGVNAYSSLKEFLNCRYRCLDYCFLIDTLASLPAVKSVSARLYSVETLINNSIVDDFFSSILPHGRLGDIVSSKDRPNPSISVEAALILNELMLPQSSRKFLGEYNALRMGPRDAVKALLHQKGTKYFFTLNDCLQVNSDFLDCNRQLTSRDSLFAPLLDQSYASSTGIDDAVIEECRNALIACPG